MRKLECKKYSLCLDDAAKKNLPDLNCQNCKEMSNYLKPEKKDKVIKAIESGKGIRETSRETGVAKNTVKKIQTLVVAQRIEEGVATPCCECGREVGHRGWCKTRIQKSPKRQKFLKKWSKPKEFISTEFEELIKQYGKHLEKGMENLHKDIETKMAEYMRLGARHAAFGEYLDWVSGPKGIDSESQEKLVNQYFELEDLTREIPDKEEEP